MYLESVTRRRKLACGTALLVAFAGAPQAVAHDWGPTASSAHYLSIVKRVVPAVPGLSLAVADRDDRLVLTNGTGKTVIVKGYGYEPYLRFDGRGVWVNRRSPNR